MIKKLVVLTAAVVLSTGFVFADEAAMAPEAAGAAVSEAVEVGNTICPISGEALDPATAEKVTVNGKIYNVCKMGKEAFDKDPAAMAEKFTAFDSKVNDEMNMEMSAEEGAEMPAAEGEEMKK